LPGWQKLYTELREHNFEIVAAAEDTGGEAAAGRWYDRANATFTTLVDAQHAISSAYQFVNVPMGIWVDENGRVARPAEPAWNTDQVMKITADKSIATEGRVYTDALRDWVLNGSRSRFALSDEEFARRVKPRSAAEMEADASFKLAVWFHQNGNDALAAKYWEHAQQLNPEDWNYHRQEWSFGPEAGKKWMEKFEKLDKPYYPPLDIKK
jgi:hypothetical protein